jgi:restriction system protein
MGYGGAIKDAGKVVGRQVDEGIDVIIEEDKLGLETIYIQAKKWEGVIGRLEIQKFVGALAGQGAKKGIFITTSKFTKEAMAYQPKSDTKIVLIDGEQLAEYMIDYDLAVSHVKSFIIKRIDSDRHELLHLAGLLLPDFFSATYCHPLLAELQMFLFVHLIK